MNDDINSNTIVINNSEKPNLTLYNKYNKLKINELKKKFIENKISIYNNRKLKKKDQMIKDLIDLIDNSNKNNI